MKSEGRITIVVQNFLRSQKQSAGAVYSPHHYHAGAYFRVSVALTPSRKAVRFAAQKRTVERGTTLNGVSFSGEDEKLRTYYHGEKKFFLAIRTRFTKIGDVFYQPPLRGYDAT